MPPVVIDIDDDDIFVYPNPGQGDDDPILIWLHPRLETRSELSDAVLVSSPLSLPPIYVTNAN